jgi:hypothetical protein
MRMVERTDLHQDGWVPDPVADRIEQAVDVSYRGVDDHGLGHTGRRSVDDLAIADCILQPDPLSKTDPLTLPESVEAALRVSMADERRRQR